MVEKIVVEVVARFDTAGGMGIRCTVRIFGKQRYLCFEDLSNTWFVEG